MIKKIIKKLKHENIEPRMHAVAINLITKELIDLIIKENNICFDDPTINISDSYDSLYITIDEYSEDDTLLYGIQINIDLTDWQYEEGLLNVTVTNEFLKSKIDKTKIEKIKKDASYYELEKELYSKENRNKARLRRIQKLEEELFKLKNA